METSEDTRTTGEPLAAASPNAATAFAAPGPVVVSAAPSPPLARASPSAAYTVVCSCRTPTIRGRPGPSASQNARFCAPGSPNAVSTPAAASTSRTPAATVRSDPIRETYGAVREWYCRTPP